jgi:predicted secreted hydrolase
MGVRLEPADEYLHELGPEPNFNESMYFNLYDPGTRVGGFFRLANRANEGSGEMTACIYLPDGRVAFMFRRPEVHSNEVFNAGGMHFAVVNPFEELTVDYQGKVVVMDDPLQMVEPKLAFTTNPTVEATVRLRYTAVSAMFGGEPDQPHERPGEEFARGHYEQLVAATGTISVDGQEWEVSGFGLRDHSWGPRYWQAPWYYRWLTANVGDEFGFMASRIARKEGPGTRGGFVWENSTLHLCNHAEVHTTWAGNDTYHAAIDVTLASGGEQWHVRGRVLNLIPLRNRRQGFVTRISEGLTEWTTDDGRLGYGLSEYLDQIVDGHPVGVDE